MWGPAGTAQLDCLELRPTRCAWSSLRDLIELYGREIEILDRRISLALKDDRGYKAIQAIHGVGPVLAAVSWPRSATPAASRLPDRPVLLGRPHARHGESDTRCGGAP